MKSFRRTGITAAIAASLLLGGAVSALPRADAAAAAGPVPQADNSVEDKGSHAHHHGHARGAGSILQESSALLGMDQQTLVENLRQGKTLAQIAKERKGWSKQVYVEKLTAAVSKQLDQAVKDGKMTQAQADQMTAKLPQRLDKLVDRSLAGKPIGWMKPEQVAKILGMSVPDLRSELAAGKSLADIAKSKGISEDQLIGKLKDSMTDDLKRFVEHRREPATVKSSK